MLGKQLETEMLTYKVDLVHMWLKIYCYLILTEGHHALVGGIRSRKDMRRIIWAFGPMI